MWISLKYLIVKDLLFRVERVFIEPLINEYILNNEFQKLPFPDFWGSRRNPLNISE